MALVTVQRSPSPSGSAETDEQDQVDADDSNLKSPRQRRRRSKSALKKLRKLFNTVRFVSKLKPCFSESYFTVKGAALILPQSDYERTYARKQSKCQGDIQSHLQAMFSLLRPQDTIKVAVKLEGSHTRYLAVVSCIGRQDTEESVILGINLREKPEIGLYIPIWAHTKIELDGDGGFSIKSERTIHIFKPVSVQAMWSALQSLNKVVKISTDNLYIPRGLTHTWLGFYEAKLSTDMAIVSEWNVLTDIDSSYRLKPKLDEIADEEEFTRELYTELKLVMMTVDLEEVTCRYLRECLEEKLGMDLHKYRGVIDLQMFEIMGQMDAPTKILDYLYLGSEWNASNLEELQHNGVQYILNISREIDNFFIGILHYMNIREWDVEQTNLLPYWEETHKFINKVRKKGSKALVHCKMGISRSASTVIAYLMKENKWSLQEAYGFTKSKRGIINPNSGFWKQLITYEGILKASWNRQSFEKKVDTHERPKAIDEVPENVEYNSAEDMLATNLGKDFPESSDLPFLQTEKDIEIGSRSADSTEDSFPDNLSPDMTTETSRKPRKKKMPRLDSNVAESGDYISSDSTAYTDSDSLSSDSEDNGERVLQPINIPSINIDKGQEDNMVVRPKGRRVKSEGDKTLITMDEGSDQRYSRESSVSKYRPDGSWIKTEGEDDEAGETALVMEKGNQDEVIDTPKDVCEVNAENIQIDSELESKTVNISVDKVSKSEKAADEKDDNKYETSEEEKVKTVDEANDATLKERVKQLDPYIKENIPWNAGTVLKHKQDLEDKYPSCPKSKNDPLSDKDKQSTVEETEKAETTITADQTIESVVNETVTQIVEHTVNKEQEDVLVDMKDNNSSDGDMKDYPDVDTSPLESMKTKRTVYDLEEINLPEGIVKKTMMEIEQRNRLPEKESPGKRLQRSSSLKSIRDTPKAKDRNNERRKTCIAILSPTYNRSDSNQSAGTDTDHDKAEMTDKAQLEASELQASFDPEDDLNQTGTVKIYKYLGEELSVQEGLVRKQTLDIEHKSKETKQTSLKPEKQQTEHYLCTPHQSEHNAASKQITQSTIEESNQAELSEEVTKMANLADASSGHVVTTDEKSMSQSMSVSVQNIKNFLYDGAKKSGDSTSDDQTSRESVSCTPQGQRSKSLGSRPESCFDHETLQLIREIGSALMNSPAKCEIDDSVKVFQGKSLVNHYVREIEKNVKFSKKKPKREIVIIEKENQSATEQTIHIPGANGQQHPICDSSEIQKVSSRDSSVALRNNTSLSPQSGTSLSPKPDDTVSSLKWLSATKKELTFEQCDKTIVNTHDKDRLAHKLSDSGDKTTADSTEKVINSRLNTGILAHDNKSKETEEVPDSEIFSVKSLVGKFTAKSGGSPTSSPSLSDTGGNDHGTSSSTDTTDVNLTGQSTKGSGNVKTPPRSLRPLIKLSEPVISLSERSLLSFSKTVGLGPMDRLTEEQDTETVEIRQNTGDRPERPKSVGQSQDSQGASGFTKRQHLRQSQALSECDGQEIFSWEGKKLKMKKTYGKSHPLAKLEKRNSMDSIRSNPFYNTM